MMRTANLEIEVVIIVGDKIINRFRYVNDTELLRRDEVKHHVKQF